MSELKPIPATQEGADRAAALLETLVDYLRQFSDKSAVAAGAAVLGWVADVKPQLPAR